ncbi:MAG: hypothetical protein S4CHLAM123_07720 [Chlamydiales bacterium]|nr:hypothetical protein [Chlamydiales bacterium]
MQILYPYNELLPRKKAHDVYIFHECAALAQLGIDVSLFYGKGASKQALFKHYRTSPSKNLHLHPRLLIRKNNPFNLSWNLPFFFDCQRHIASLKPNFVFLSVLKQAAYHLQRKIKGVRYIYEVHELAHYPTQPAQNIDFEKKCLEKADLITVTTHALKQILQNPPYSLTVPIEVIPLAVHAQPLVLSPKSPCTLMYVGQLYEEQGIKQLLQALAQTENVHLKIVGGTSQEIAHFSNMAQTLSIAKKVDFLGFIPPHQLPQVVNSAHAFVAPFENKGRMPYVAHTKLLEYAEWGRPIIAPDLPLVREHLQDALLFEPDNPNALAACIQALTQESIREHHQQKIAQLSGSFTWHKRAQRMHQLLTSL